MAHTFQRIVSGLWCLHWPGPVSGVVTDELRRHAVVLRTCLRQLAFGLGPGPVPVGLPGGERFAGAEAYRLLLEVACGLRSAVPGETNVGGQFLRAWEESAWHLAAPERSRLRPVVQALRADMRSLRARHLQGLAGDSYGSLVRELLAPAADARILFIGTGGLARSMLPLFRAWQVAAWNHRDPTSDPALLTRVDRCFASAEADLAAAWATDFIFTTPADATHDATWAMRLQRHAHRRVIHLGWCRDTSGTWPGVSAPLVLDDVFALAAARAGRRQQQLAAATAALVDLINARLAGPRAEPCSA